MAQHTAQLGHLSQFENGRWALILLRRSVDRTFVRMLTFQRVDSLERRPTFSNAFTLDFLNQPGVDLKLISDASARIVCVDSTILHLYDAQEDFAPLKFTEFG